MVAGLFPVDLECRVGVVIPNYLLFIPCLFCIVLVYYELGFSFYW